MSDYRLWCRLCGSLEGTSEIEVDLLQIIEQIFEVPSDDIRMCADCHFQIVELQKLINTTRILDRLFTGLKQENDSDLTITRLNAYRAHFNLKSMISEEEQVEEEYECYEYDAEVKECEETLLVESLGDNFDEAIAESIDDATLESMEIIQEDYDIVDDEIYEDRVEEIESSYMSDDSLESQRHRKKVRGSMEKTKDEELFAFQCHLCSAPEFPKMSLLTLHCRQLHDSLPRVSCCSEECGTVLSTWRRLLIHKEKHFPSNDRFRCEVCKSVYLTAKRLEQHMPTHKLRYVCGYCGKTFKMAKTLRWHEETHIKSLEERRNFQCSYPDCGLRFITKQACQNHIEMKHLKEVNFYCPEPTCNKPFYTRKHLTEHMRVHGERKYCCDQCSFRTKTRSALNTHKDVHKVGHTYYCDYCNSSFPVYRRLKNHMICHSDATPFQCSHCDSAFKRSKDLKSHINIHTKERPFKCQFCDKGFANSANCRKHKLKDHPAELSVYEAVHGRGKKQECYE